MALGEAVEPEKSHEELIRDREALGGEELPELDDKEEKHDFDRQHAEAERGEKKQAVKGKADADGSRLKTETQVALKQKLNDGFEKKGQDDLKSQQLKAQKLASTMAPQTPPPSRAGKPADAMTLLHSAQDPGVYYKEGDREGGGHHEGQPEEELDPDLLEAVAEATRLLAEVKGIKRIVPGTDQEGAKVVVIVADRGFGEVSMREVPPMIRQFPTLLALPYELLPLRRERLV